MASTLLESSALSAFCGSIATMLSAGIQTDEAVLMLAENREDSHFKRVCDRVYQGLAESMTLAAAMEASKAFPRYAIDMVETGERTGRTERVLRSLDLYYDEEHRIFEKIKASVGYPAALLCIMAVILGFTNITILPVFTRVYQNMTGTLTAESFASVDMAVAIGWIAFVLVLVCAVAALGLVVASRSEQGRLKVIALFEKVPATRDALYQLALSRFTVALATHLSSGVNNEDAMQAALNTVTHPTLKKHLEAARDAMLDLDAPRSLAQAITENDVFEPLYARMLTVGSRTGSTDDVLERLSQIFFSDSVVQIDRVIDRIEPALAAFLTIAVGATLISVMLPLIGIMGSIV